MNRATIAISGGLPEELPIDTPVVTPLVQSVNFIQTPGTSDGLLYTRTGNTPNVSLVEKRLALLEGAEAAVLTSSGMGAISATMLALLRPGDHLISSSWIYGGAHQFFATELRDWGIEVSFVDPSDNDTWKKEIRSNTRAIFIESPVNPTCRVLDVAAISAVAREAGVALVIDATIACPINFRPLEHGVDVVIHSATKFLNGHHDILGGVILADSEFVNEARSKIIKWGQSPDPFACWLLERGLKTIDVRVKRQNENAMTLATWCESRDEFSRVLYPGLASHPDHELAQRTLDGFGGMLGVELKGGADAATAFIRRLRLAMHAPSLGGVDTLVSEPRFMSHGYMTPEERAAMGVPDGFVRISVGLEDVQDIIADFDQALD